MSFIRDSITGALVNADDNGFQSFNMAKEKAKRDIALRQDVEHLKKQVSDLQLSINKILEIISKENN